MVGDQLAKFESKVNSSLSGNFSTSESTHSKQRKQQQLSLQKCIGQGQFRKSSEQIQLEDIGGKHQKVVDQTQNRLFTFMDEKDCQKKMIQNFLFNRTNRQHHLSDQNYENNAQLLNMANAGIQRIIKDSNNKRQQFAKKLSNLNLPNKQIISNKRLQNPNKSRTPINIRKNIHNYMTIDVKNEPTTRKYDSYRSITPKYEKQKRLIRAKSSLDSNFLNFNETLQKKQLKQVEMKKQLQKPEYSKKVNHYDVSIKQLLKKKKQLEKQLIEINSSLLCRKKKRNMINTTTKKKNDSLKNITNRKKSVLKLAQCKIK